MFVLTCGLAVQDVMVFRHDSELLITSQGSCIRIKECIECQYCDTVYWFILEVEILKLILNTWLLGGKKFSILWQMF